MTDKILVEGDIANFLPAFTPAVVVVQPGQMKASGPATIGGKKICIDGDESKLEVPGCQYVTPTYPIPGTGTLKISKLAGDQKAKHSTVGGTAMLLLGSQFDATFEVQSKASQVPPSGGPPVFDGKGSYDGKGSFVAANATVSGT